jgi:hypothetical protein
MGYTKIANFSAVTGIAETDSFTRRMNVERMTPEHRQIW